MVWTPTNRILNHRGYLQRNATKGEREKKGYSNEREKRMKHRLDAQTFTHLHQRQPGRSEEVAMVPFPALARTMATLEDLEVTGADAVHVVHE